jgi:hypothetical protein
MMGSVMTVIETGAVGGFRLVSCVSCPCFGLYRQIISGSQSGSSHSELTSQSAKLDVL